MHKKTASLLAMVVALGGFALAAFIPAASAEKGHNTYTQYCENGTNTVYHEYNQYCETTTTVVNNGTTTVVTSPVTTPITTPTTTTTGTTPGSAIAAGVTIGADGVYSIDVAQLKPGESFTVAGVKVKVLRYTKDGVEMSFGGVAVDVPTVASVSIAADGVAQIAYAIVDGKPHALRVAETTSAVLKATARQYTILPSGHTVGTATFTLTKGVSFGAKTTWATIGKAFSVVTIGSKATKVPLKVAANKARTSATIRLVKNQKAFVTYFNVGSLQYTKAEQTAITKNKITSLAAKYTVRSFLAPGKSIKADTFAFSYPVS